MSTKKKIRILVVDDHPLSAQIVARLAVRAGMTAALVGNRADARNWLGEQPDPFDVVVSDVDMPWLVQMGNNPMNGDGARTRWRPASARPVGCLACAARIKQRGFFPAKTFYLIEPPLGGKTKDATETWGNKEWR